MIRRTIGILILISISAAMTITAGITFNDSLADRISVTNGKYWTIELSKTNGAIISVQYLPAGREIIIGSRNENLWRAVFFNESLEQVYASDFRHDGVNKFSYSWDSINNALTLKYTSNPQKNQSVDVTTWFRFSDKDYFDIQVSVKNSYNDYLKYIHMPNGLSFKTDIIEHAYIPILPGIKLKRSFFDAKRDTSLRYPGQYGVFADFFHIVTTVGNVTVYSVNNSNRVYSCLLGILYEKRSGIDTHYFQHGFAAGTSQGETFQTPLVRIRLGETLKEAAENYRVDNGIDKYPDVWEKLGNLWDSVRQSINVKADITVIKEDYRNYNYLIFSRMPKPAIFHPVAYQDGGFDENNPDVLPVNPDYGTNSDFKAMLDQAKASGFIVMPYTNPTWWDNESDTFMKYTYYNPPEDILVVDYYGNTTYETYGSKGGYVVSPYSEFVKEKNDRLITQMTEYFPSEMLFEDQIGARSWQFDFNTNSPTPIDYINGWIDHTREYSSQFPLSTEWGFDKLAATDYGFFGTALYLDATNIARKYWGYDNYVCYPLASMMFGDKVLFYQHDLADETLTVNYENLQWNTAYGHMLGFRIQNPYREYKNTWYRMIYEIQKYVISRISGKRLTDYEVVNDNYTITKFGDYTIHANWLRQDTLNVGQFEISAEGVLVQSDDGSFTAGNFAVYKGHVLSHGWQTIVEDRQDNVIYLYHPYGYKTSLVLDMLDSWPNDYELGVYHYDEQGRVIEVTIPEISNRQIILNIEDHYNDSGIAWYEIKEYKPKRKRITK